MIKIKSHLSGFHFDDNFITLRLASCIIAPDPIFPMALLYEITCWNHISDYHTVLNPYDVTWWQLTLLHCTDVISWMTILHIVVNENDLMCHSNVTHYWKLMILCFMRHFTRTINAIMEIWNTWLTWSLEVNVVWYVTMILTSTFERKYMPLPSIRNFRIHFHWYRNKIMPWYYVMIWWVFHSFYFGHVMFLYCTMWYKSIQNLIRLGCFVLEISSFQFDEYRGFRTAAGVHKLFVGGVCVGICRHNSNHFLFPKTRSPSTSLINIYLTHII